MDIQLLLRNGFFLSLILTSGSCTPKKNKSEPTKKYNYAEQFYTPPEVKKDSSNRVKNSLDCTIDLTPELRQHGLSISEYYLIKDSLTKRQNILAIEVLFVYDFNRKLVAKLFSRKGKELGKVITKAHGFAGEEKIIRFPFGAIAIEEKASLVVSVL